MDNSIVVLKHKEIKRARQAEEEIKQVCIDIGKRYIMLGYMLDEFDANRQWEALGYGSFKEWCDWSEHCPVGYKRANAAKRVWKLFVVKMAYDPDKLYLIGEAKFQVITKPISDIVDRYEEIEGQVDHIRNQIKTLQYDTISNESDNSNGMNIMRNVLNELQYEQQDLKKKASTWLNNAMSLSRTELKKIKREHSTGYKIVTSYWIDVRVLTQKEKELLQITDLKHGKVQIMVGGYFTKTENLTG